MKRNVKSSAALAALLIMGLMPAGTAQAQPTQAQQNALRSNCRSDFMSNCSGVTPGGAEALQCLKRNVAKLSPGCQGAVNALSPPAAPQQKATAPAAPAAAPAPAASAPAAKPAVPAAAAPAKSNSTTTKRSNPTPTRTARPAPPPAAAPAAVAAPPPAAMPTAAQQSAIRLTCRGDFMANCRGVTPGGPEALACLQRNAARLSPDCRTSLAALDQDVPTAAAAPRRRPLGPIRRAIRDRMERQ